MLKRANDINDLLVAWRRDFHMYPELGFEEIRTPKKIVEILKPLGYRIRTGVGRTGVIADIGYGKPVVAFRADMDALPLTEENNVPYASRIPGLMHACGHDAHVAIALGTATLLAEDDLPGTVRFIFQPAEENSDDEGIAGAQRMIEDGAMDGVDGVFALHVEAAVPVGAITVDNGPSTAGVDSFYANIIGRGGHGATPDKVVDPIHIAGHVILAFHGIVSRRMHPFNPAVISIGSIHGGQASNVIPESVEISGTMRYMLPEVQTQLHSEIERALEVARALGGDYDLDIEIGYPPMFNDTGAVELIRGVASDIIGVKHVKKPARQMGAEDFGFFSNIAPGAMFQLGCRIKKDEREHHSPYFDIDEKCLPIGAAILTGIAHRFLNDPPAQNPTAEEAPIASK